MNFVLLSNEENDILTGYMEKNGFDMPVYRMVQNPPNIMQSSIIPTTFLLDPDGRIIVKKTGAAKWDGRFFKDFLASELAK